MSFRSNPTPKRHRAWAIALAVSAFACAKERAPIDRTQPDALKKSFFVGENLSDPSDDPEFYAQGTLIRVGYGAAQDGLFTSTYAQPVTRIKWVVQEDQLVGRLTYQRIDDSDGMGAGPTSTDGQVVYVYAIKKHFDIRRSYNDSTGEELNVLVENDTDRPWYQREYMRVDWSKNMNTDAYDLDTLSMVGVYGGIEYEPLAYYVNDPSDPDAPHFDNGDHYFDVTNKAFAKPATIDLSQFGLGKFPLCFLGADFSGGSAPAGNCNPVELTIRQSFRRVVDHDYEPAEWDGLRFQALGAFTTDRHGYARNYGMSDDKFHRFISRYNIWERSHVYDDATNMTGPVACFTNATTPLGADPHRDENGDGTEDECSKIGRGSRCDEFKQRCTIPFRDRTVKPIAWYYTPDSDPTYFAATEAAALQWDVAMRSAIATARYAECMRTDKNQAACLAAYPVYFGQQNDNENALALVREIEDCRHGRAYAGQDCNAVADQLGQQRSYSAAVVALAKQDPVVSLCHSPVVQGDDKSCGAVGLTVRHGDLRYHQINVIQEPQNPSPWGIMVDADDPLTGEKLAASVNVWAFVNDLWSQGIIDRLRYLNGELGVSEITDGKYVQDWVNADRKASNGGILPRLTKAELDQRIADFAHTTPEGLEASRQALAANPAIRQGVNKLTRDVATVRADANVQASSMNTYEARRQHAIGTESEAALNTTMMRQFAGVSNLPINPETTALSSPLQGTNPLVMRNLRQLRENKLAERGSCIRNEAPAPATWTGLTGVLQEKFGHFDASEDKATQSQRAERMRHYLAHTAHTSVILHEMGHSFGLRHNFVSSADAFGYRPQYWQLRTKNGADLPECTDLTQDGSTCVGPRWFDPVTDEERNGLMNMFMQSTVMDYAGDYSQDMIGLGVYDFAAVRMFYGDVIAVHADSSYAVGQPRGTAMLSKADDFGGIIGFQWSKDGSQDNGIHYSQLQKNFDLIQNCQTVDPTAFRPADWNEAEKGTWSPLLDGHIVQVDGAYTRCNTQQVDYTTWTSLRDASDAEAGGRAKSHVIDPAGRTRVPYGFATDRWADLGNLAVYRHDNGADPYELFDFFISEQEVNHIFDNYRRGRESFAIRTAVTRTLERYNEKMRDGAKGLGLFANIYRDFALAQGYDYTTLWPAIVGQSRGSYNALATNVLASEMAFDHFSRQLARPEAGEHFQADGGDTVLRSASNAPGIPNATLLVVPNGVAGTTGGISIGGRPVENQLASDRGEYNSEYTMNAGSYYEKLFSSMLLTESVDNFISESRGDFVDGRYRAVSMADLFPDGYRRWLGNNLTNDDALKAAWIPAQGGNPMVDGESKYPAVPLAWTSWWSNTPKVCSVSDGAESCTTNDLTAATQAYLPIDPEVGWEQQKFLIAWTLMYLPENQQRWWLDNLGIWSLGDDTDPGFENRIEFHDPTGRVFIAKTFGKETVFGRSIQKGIAARMLQHANELLQKAYETTPGPDNDHDGQPDWYVPRIGNSGNPLVRWDASVATITGSGGVSPNGRLGCNASSNTGCTCTDNKACVELSRYVAVPGFMRQAMRDFGMADPSMRGLY